MRLWVAVPGYELDEAGQPREVAGLTALLVPVGCRVGPDPEPVQPPMPETWRFGGSAAQKEALADLPWWELFAAATLRRHIETALERNWDLRIAAARIARSRGLLRSTRSLGGDSVTVSSRPPATAEGSGAAPAGGSGEAVAAASAWSRHWSMQDIRPAPCSPRSRGSSRG